MFKYATLNNIAEAGLARFDENFEKTDDINEAQGILVRSAKMHDMEFSDKLVLNTSLERKPTELAVKGCIIEKAVPVSHSKFKSIANAPL